MDEAIIKIEHLNKEFQVDKKPMQVLRDINLKVRKGEFVTIVGHSGCGKSTLLKIMCGLVPYEDGVVERNGHKVVGPGPMCGMVFQDHRLLPWLKIKDNVGFGLKSLSKEEREKTVSEHLEMVGLKGFENSYPAQLSGGMSQRAAIARGLANNPSILLLDEPLGKTEKINSIWRNEKMKNKGIVKKIGAVLFATVITAGTLVGCGADKAEAESIIEKVSEAEEATDVKVEKDDYKVVRIGAGDANNLQLIDLVKLAQNNGFLEEELNAVGYTYEVYGFQGMDCFMMMNGQIFSMKTIFWLAFLWMVREKSMIMEELMPQETETLND